MQKHFPLFRVLLAIISALAVINCAALVARAPQTGVIIPTATPSYPYEPHVPGCQDLDALKAKPIKLTGKIFATYLPDGKRYTKLKPPSAPDFFEVGVLDFDKPGSKIRRLTADEAHDAEVRVSPDGKKIVWSVRPALDLFDGDNTIMFANADMTEKKVLAHGTSKYLGIPSFAKPLGDRVLFSSQGEGDEFAKLMVFDFKTSTLKQHPTNFQGAVADPQMSHDGKKIVFKSYKNDDPETVWLYLMNADGSGARKLTFQNYRDEDPAFSPDDGTVAFERMYGLADHKSPIAEDFFFKEGIVSVDLRTGKEKALTEPDVCGKNELWLPTWSPDGKYIMMTRGLHLESGEFTHDLWVMRKDGSDLQRVPNSDGIMFFDWVK